MAMQVLGLRPCEGKDGLSTPALADNIMTGIKAPPQVRSLYLKHLAVLVRIIIIIIVVYNVIPYHNILITIRKSL